MVSMFLKYWKRILTKSIWLCQEEFEDTKGVIRIRISKKNIQHNGQKKNYKRTNNDLQNIHETKDRITWTPLKTGGELMSSGSKGSNLFGWRKGYFGWRPTKWRKIPSNFNTGKCIPCYCRCVTEMCALIPWRFGNLIISYGNACLF